MELKSLKVWLLIFISIFSLLQIQSSVNALDIGSDSSAYPGVIIGTPGFTPVNYSVLNVNNSQYLQGFNVSTLKDWMQGFFDNLYCKLIGCTIEGNVNIKGDLLVMDAHDDNNTILEIASGFPPVNSNASLTFTEAGLSRWSWFYDGLNNNLYLRDDLGNGTQSKDFYMCNIATDNCNYYVPLNFSAGVYPQADLYCDSQACYNLSLMNNNLSNLSNNYIPYIGAVANVDLGDYNLSLNGSLHLIPDESLFFQENLSSNNNSYFIYNTTTSRLELWANGRKQQDWGNSTTIYGKATFESDAYFENISGVGLLINTNVVVTGNITGDNICYSNGNNCSNSTLVSGYVPYIGANNNINLGIYNLSLNEFNASGDVYIKSEKGADVKLNNFVVHTQEMMTDTLLDKSRSLLTAANGQLNYTLYAVNGAGQWNFNGTLYFKNHTGVPNATISLICGTNITPITNYIHFKLVGDTPTLAVTPAYPTYEHIDVGTFIIGECSGNVFNIYSYSRNRYEVDSFVKRVIARFEDTGTLYKDGFYPTVNLTDINITIGSFFNGIFLMNSTNVPSLSSGFYWINSTGNFVQATSLASLNQYSDGTAFTGTQRMNIVWGVVPINTTGGVGPTQMKLVAVPQANPGASRQYVSAVLAEQDQFLMTLYFPSNSEVKKVFTPIARTIIRASTSQFEQFQSGAYLRDIRGQVTSSGSAPSATLAGILLADGTVPLSDNWNFGNFNINGTGNITTKGYMNATGVINTHSNFSVNNIQGITQNFNMTNGTGKSCWMNFTGGLLTWSNC